MVVILANMSDPDSDDEIMQMLLDQIPHVEKFQKYYILGEEWLKFLK